MQINIAEIKISPKDEVTKRFRAKTGSVVDLANSIHNNGLLHPIVVAELENDARYKWLLIAGERRLKAHIMNASLMIEATLKVDTTALSRKSMELEENVRRKQLEWPEYVEALDQLDKLRKMEHGEATRASNNEGWGVKDTADALGMSVGAVSMDLKLARDIKANPDLLKKVRKMPKTAARKIVNQELKARELKRQVDKNEISISSDIRHGSCVDLISDVPDESVDMLFTDPPFAIQKIIDVANPASTSYYNATDSNVSDPLTMLGVYNELMPKLFKKMKPGAHVYMMLGMGWYSYLIDKMREVGFLMDDLPIIWNKGRPSIMAQDNHYMSYYQAVLFGYKPPASRVLKNATKNIIDVPTIAPQKRVHSLQLPFDLLKIFIENSSSVGELVLDCFCGSGSTVHAARKLQRSAVAFELDEGNFLRAQKFVLGD